jgi:hypothetical protein
VEYAGVDGELIVLRGMKEEEEDADGAKASADAIDATIKRAVRKFIFIG